MSAPVPGPDRAGPERNLKGSAVLLLVLVLVAVAAWYLTSPARDSTNTAASSSVGSGDVIQQYAEGDRKAVEPFVGALLDGGEFDSTALQGGVSVVNVWGSWCGPCREEAPVLAQVAGETEDEGVQFLGINVRDNPDAARAFERTFDVPYPSIVPDDSPEALLAFGGLLASAAVPSTVVVDPDGRVAARVVGTVTAPTLRALIEDASTGSAVTGR